MSTVTLDRKLADALLILMHRVYSGEVVPPGQWRLFMTDLEQALETQPPRCPYCQLEHNRPTHSCPGSTEYPRTHEDAPGATQEPVVRQPLTLAGAIALVANAACSCPMRLHCDAPGPLRHPACRTCPYCQSAIPATCLGLLCTACQGEFRLPDRDFCGPCQDELNADLAELHDRRQSGHPGSRCNAACSWCGACG